MTRVATKVVHCALTHCICNKYGTCNEDMISLDDKGRCRQFCAH